MNPAGSGVVAVVQIRVMWMLGDQQIVPVLDGIMTVNLLAISP